SSSPIANAPWPRPTSSMASPCRSPACRRSSASTSAAAIPVTPRPHKTTAAPLPDAKARLCAGGAAHDGPPPLFPPNARLLDSALPDPARPNSMKPDSIRPTPRRGFFSPLSSGRLNLNRHACTAHLRPPLRAYGSACPGPRLLAAHSAPGAVVSHRMRHPHSHRLGHRLPHSLENVFRPPGRWILLGVDCQLRVFSH